MLYTVCLQTNPDFTASQPWRLLVVTLSTLVDLLLSESSGAKVSLQKGVLSRTRRALRSVSPIFLFPS
jgi:hypothetical protein